MRIIAAVTIILMSAEAGVHAQAGPQVTITMRLAAPARLSGGAYFMAFTVDDSVLTGPQSDSSSWTHYVLYRGGRFFFGRVPSAAFRPFEFVSVRPPQAFPFGQVLSGGTTLRARVALAELQAAAGVISRMKINFVTVDDQLRPLDALGEGASDRFGFVTLDLRRDTYLAVLDRQGDASDPAFDITGGDIQVGTP